MAHSKTYWDLVPLDKVKKTNGNPREFTRAKDRDWRKAWREHYVTLIRQASEYISPSMMYSRQAGWR